jgi:hypothetical protein
MEEIVIKLGVVSSYQNINTFLIQIEEHILPLEVQTETCVRYNFWERYNIT